MTVSVEISVMAREDVQLALEWAAAEGWNPGRFDVDNFRAPDPEGFLAAHLEGRMVGSISSIRYAGDFGFIGMFIVVPELRGIGIGSQLWTAAMARQSGRVVGLDGVVAMQDSYARSGFVLAHRNLRYSGSLHRASSPATDGELVTLGAADLDEVLAYDSPCFGSSRAEFLAQWLAQPSALTVGVRTATSLAGYCTVRPAREGFKIGPLFADQPDTARQLIGAVREYTGHEAVVCLDVPEPNAAARQIADELGMTVSFETARMYAAGDVTLPLDRVFGITSYELG